jgi:mRNA interferase HigB
MPLPLLDAEATALRSLRGEIIESKLWRRPERSQLRQREPMRVRSWRLRSLTYLPKWEILTEVRVIAKSSLKKFWERPGCADARGPLHSWYAEAIKATWHSPQDIKDQYASASICGNNRAVFNVGGNKYRLVVEVQYQSGIVWVKFVGTHAQYDRIDVETVNAY